MKIKTLVLIIIGYFTATLPLLHQQIVYRIMTDVFVIALSVTLTGIAMMSAGVLSGLKATEKEAVKV